MEADEIDALSSQHKEMLTQFMMVTAIENDKTALQFLKMCDFNLEQAINTALETGGNIAPDQARPQPPRAPQAPVTPTDSAYYNQGPAFNNQNAAPLPEFTDEENEYYQYRIKQSEGNGIVKGVSKIVGGLTSWLPFKTTTGDEFLKHIYKTLGRRTKLLIQFQKISIEKTLDDMSLDDDKPLLIYIHKNDHKLTQHILDKVIQNPKNAHYNPMGILTSNREMKIVMNFIEKEAIPCFLILRKDKLGKVCKTAQVELNCEGYLSLEVIFALLQEANENFRETRNHDKVFVSNFDNKIAQRREVINNRLNPLIDNGFGGMGFQQPPRQQQPAQPTQADIRRQQELERERQEQELQYQQMQQQREMEAQQKADEERRQREEEERIAREAEEEARRLEEEKANRRRKLSEMPEEPAIDAEGVIKIAFRLPNGQRLLRNFYNSEKLELLYDFVYAQEDIGLENQSAEIQILTSYPPKPLTEMEKSLFDLFGASKQELLIIKEDD